ncbi:hypothetical protein NA56DRAFT_625597 [Hyaloscypha hepaticicola]|uniref:Uncharacterized protein n=1 Tax=Hyaloscypha hepaticicola TaxID=2082293 RepID=A0A2J6Q5X4_9HELO|nr:hypothetical protein NA56DRAFT_625597 [Hyaloscypha hepaticicola]
MSSNITAGIMELINPFQKSLTIEQTGHRIPIVASLSDVTPEMAIYGRACILRNEQLILVWSTSSETIMDVGSDVEMQLYTLVRTMRTFDYLLLIHLSSSMSVTSKRTTVRGALNEDDELFAKAVALEEGAGEDEDDVEGSLPKRPVSRVHSVKISIAMMLVVFTQAVGISKLVGEYTWDGRWLPFLLVLTIPPLTCFSLFFFIVVVTCVFQVVLPLGNVLKNTKYHSAIKPKSSRYRDYELPHITIQMPVYKEGLRGVIVPTIISVMAAIEEYEKQGGTASVFINDDGMQAIEPELAEARKRYYKENGIGYTARLPQHKNRPAQKSHWWSKKKQPVIDDKQGVMDEGLSPSQALANKIGFLRKGKFKKASNMNYGLAFSERVEKEFSRLMQIELEKRGITEEDLTVDDDDAIYQQALNNMLVADEGRTWADGNIRVGELILIIDCDTRVPVDCLLYGALEMYESPEVAILQHGSGVMQVVHNVFENGITYFTNIVYSSIKYGVGCGDVAPFVGHNAFIRWKALQSVAFFDESDGQTKWWSDTCVSEDFDLSLRLQMSGCLVRLATYHNGEFREGVSLTLYDELTRWEKYAYGCNELIFHPFSKWLYKGPFTALFRRFLFSNIQITSKVTVIAYISTYYAIGAGLFLSLVNYFALGLFPDDLDHDYLPSFGIWISLVVIFSGVSGVAFAMLRHQMKEKSFWPAYLDSLKWLPFLMLFFGGISVNCAKALICHAFGIDISWGSTAKEIGDTSFYVNLGKMIQCFKYTWAICIVLSGVMVYFSVGAPWGYNISPGPHSTAMVAIFPLSVQIASSFLLPFGLGWLGGRVF